jgi:hypothetical protein
MVAGEVMILGCSRLSNALLSESYKRKRGFLIRWRFSKTVKDAREIDVFLMSVQSTLLIEDRPAKTTYSGGGGMAALLWLCPSPEGEHYRYNVTLHHLDTIKKNLKYGSKLAPLKGNCNNDGYGCNHNTRLNSQHRCHVIAMVDASKHRQVYELKEVAKRLNYGYCPMGDCKEREGESHSPKCVNYCFQTIDIKAHKLGMFDTPEYSPKLCQPMKRWDKISRGGY